jgi:hypothetical protein
MATQPSALTRIPTSKEIDEDAVYRARVAGKSVRSIAHEHGSTESRINEILHEKSKGLLSEESLRIALMLENQRLDDIVVALYPKAINGDHAAAGLLIKLAQRRSCLMGLDMPQAHVLHVINNPPRDARTSTEKMSDAIDHLLGVTDREKQLRDKANTLAGGPGLTEEEAGEYQAMQDAREAKRRAAYDKQRGGPG